MNSWVTGAVFLSKHGRSNMCVYLDLAFLLIVINYAIDFRDILKKNCTFTRFTQHLRDDLVFVFIVAERCPNFCLRQLL